MVSFLCFVGLLLVSTVDAVRLFYYANSSACDDYDLIQDVPAWTSFLLFSGKRGTVGCSVLSGDSAWKVYDEDYTTVAASEYGFHQCVQLDDSLYVRVNCDSRPLWNGLYFFKHPVYNCGYVFLALDDEELWAEMCMLDEGDIDCDPGSCNRQGFTLDSASALVGHDGTTTFTKHLGSGIIEVVSTNPKATYLAQPMQPDSYTFTPIDSSTSYLLLKPHPTWVPGTYHASGPCDRSSCCCFSNTVVVETFGNLVHFTGTVDGFCHHLASPLTLTITLYEPDDSVSFLEWSQRKMSVISTRIFGIRFQDGGTCAQVLMITDAPHHHVSSSILIGGCCSLGFGLAVIVSVWAYKKRKKRLKLEQRDPLDRPLLLNSPTV